MRTYLLVLVFTIALFKCNDAATDKVICYYEGWEIERFTPEEIDVNICTIINYAFVGLNADGSIRGGEDPIIGRLARLKSKNRKLKVLLSVGGWNEGGKVFSEVANDPRKRVKMAQSALTLIKKYNLDGLDVDWEYPGQRGGKTTDKKAYVDMLRALRLTFGANYLITVAVSSSPTGGLYDVPAISSVVDVVNVMTYDFVSGGGAETRTGQNSPLYGAASCDTSIANWRQHGAPAYKLALGLAFYGHTFRLADPNDHGVGAKASGVGSGGGTLNYYEICKLTNGYTNAFDEKSKNPYKYSRTDWIGYDDARSIGLKVQYAKNHGLAGVMMWPVDGDDKGACGQKFPLLNAIKNNL